MRSSIFYAVFCGVTAALPTPQEIDLVFVVNQPDPSYTIDVIAAASQVVSYDPTSVLLQVTDAVSAVSIAVTDVASSVSVTATDIPYSGQLAKRTASACASLKPGATGVQALSSDDPTTFASNTAFAAAASNAAIPQGYFKAFTNLNASALGYGYLGFSSLDTYDTLACSRSRDTTPGCMAFNTYFERDPSVMPGSGCENPSSVTSIICALWGSSLSASNAQSYGKTTIANFKTVIAGSNGYTKQTIETPRGYSPPVDLGTAAINAPYDKQGFNTYMGFTLFTKGVFNISLCAAYCDAQTAYNQAHPPTDGSPPKICRAFNTYILYKNNPSLTQGQYCVLYTELWDKSYATNSGSWWGTDHFMIQSSYLSYNTTSQGPSPSVGDQLGATYQASKDISWSTLQPFCSRFVSTGLQSSTSSSLLSIPAGLSKYPSTVVLAACSLQVTLAKAAASSTSTQGSAIFAGSSSALTASSTTVSQATASSPSGSTPQKNSGANLPPGTSSSVLATITSSPLPSFGSGFGFAITNVTSLNGLGLSYYSSLTSKLDYIGGSTILGHLKSPTITSSVPAVTADASDLTAQPSLQAQLQQAGMPSFDSLTSDIAAALDGALMDNAITESTDDHGNWISADASNQALSRRSSLFTKRYSFGDFLEDADTVGCSDVVTSLFEVAEAVCGIKDGVQAVQCLASDCLSPAPQPPPVQYPFDNTYSLTLPSFKSGYVYKDAVSTLVCNDCGMTLTKLRLQGTIVVNLQNTSLISSTMTLSQDSVQRFNMEVLTSGPANGSWSYVMSTRAVGSITAPGIFTISPQLLYALGATWSTSKAADFSFGASSTLSGASITFDPVNGNGPGGLSWLPGVAASALTKLFGSSWTPTIAITQPQLAGTSATLTPWIQSSVQISITVLGNTVPNAIVLNNEVSLGFTSTYVNMAKLGHTQCGGGQLQSTSYRKIKTSIALPNFGSITLVSSSGNSPPVCQDGPSIPPSPGQFSALKSAAGAGAFCSSFISYKPSTTSDIIVQTRTQATSTATVIGSGTTTVTPSPTTTTITMTSSVSSIARQMKRAIIATAEPPTLGARALVARKVVPTPIVVSTWLPQQVSAVCSSIATGMVTADVTVITTITSGVTTATVQATVSAAAPITTSTSIVYVPAATPSNIAFTPNIAYPPGGSSAWTFVGGANNYYYYSGFPFKQTRNIAQLPGKGSFTQQLSGLEPGWTYNLTLTAGYKVPDDACTVTYSLDGVTIASYTPSNTGQAKGAVSEATNHYVQRSDGPYQVIPTKETQMLSIAMSCTGGDAMGEFGNVNFWGPSID